MKRESIKPHTGEIPMCDPSACTPHSHSRAMLIFHLYYFLGLYMKFCSKLVTRKAWFEHFIPWTPLILQVGNGKALKDKGS
jgi:hypothetical protein